MSKINEGDVAPDFCLKNQDEEDTPNQQDGENRISVGSNTDHLPSYPSSRASGWHDDGG